MVIHTTLMNFASTISQDMIVWFIISRNALRVCACTSDMFLLKNSNHYINIKWFSYDIIIVKCTCLQDILKVLSNNKEL